MIKLMGQTGYIILAIGIIVLLLIIFFVTYVLNKKTPVPKGCENLVDTSHCHGCSNTSCKFYSEHNNVLDELKKENINLNKENKE